MTDQQIFSYDKVIYPNYLHTQTHPDRLATMSGFFGVQAKPVERCRVLELGCGTGGSLLSFAYDLKDSEFIGIDLSEKQIEIGKQAVSEIGLKNLELRQADIMQINREDYGEFDYIIAHGIYSWVPDFVRDQILKICNEMLAEQGIAFVSYNALPGAHFGLMTRGMMMYHTRNLESANDKVNQSLSLLKFIADNASIDKNYKELLQSELKSLSERGFAGIFHDQLADFYHPVYFHEFVAHASSYNLQYVTEVEYFTLRDSNYPKEILQLFDQLGDDKIAVEQYLDFIKGRRFRQSLICRAELKVSNQPDPKFTREIRMASPVTTQTKKTDFSLGKHEIFSADGKGKIEIDHPLTKAALCYLGSIWVRSATFPEIVENAAKILMQETGAEVEVSERDVEILTDVLFKIFCVGMLRFSTHEPQFTNEVSDKPFASDLARWQTDSSDSISTLLSTSIAIEDALGKELLRLCDGTRDHAQLVRDMSEFIKSAKFDSPTEVKNHILENMPAQLEKNLKSFADLALLVS